MPQAEILARILEKVEQNCEKTEKIEKILTGNGDPQKGLIVRFDRVEQTLKRFKWVICAVIVALLAAGAETLAAKIF